jgi:hypothetical protein
MLRTKILEALYEQYLNPFSEYLSGRKKSFYFIPTACTIDEFNKASVDFVL